MQHDKGYIWRSDTSPETWKLSSSRNEIRSDVSTPRSCMKKDLHYYISGNLDTLIHYYIRGILYTSLYYESIHFPSPSSDNH